jgi:hypothetical protein
MIIEICMEKYLYQMFKYNFVLKKFVNVYIVNVYIVNVYIVNVYIVFFFSSFVFICCLLFSFFSVCHEIVLFHFRFIFASFSIQKAKE